SFMQRGQSMLYRLRRRLNYARFRLATRGIYGSPPIPCQEDVPCEIHTMLSEEDVPLYLIAIKSFLRFFPAVSVFVHSDGTVGPHSMALIRRHVPGCRIVSAPEADDRARRLLGEDSAMYRYRFYDAGCRRIVDSELWGSTKRRIIMDSDVLVLDTPEELIEWI